MRHEFVAGERIIFNNRKFIIEDREGDVVKLHDEDKNKSLVRKQKFLVEELFGGNLRFVQKNGAVADSEIPRAEYYVDLCERDRNDARRKLAYVEATVEQNVEKSTKEALSPVIEGVFKKTGGKMPAPITLYRWRRDYISSEGSIDSLAPQHWRKGNRKTKLPEEIEDMIEACIEDIYLTRRRLRIRAVYDEFKLRFAALLSEKHHFKGKILRPSKKTIYRRVKQYKEKYPYEVCCAREGKKAADLIFKDNKYAIPPSRAMERWEIDHGKMDVIAMDPEIHKPIGRPWITVALDVKTRKVAGLYITFDPPSFESVMQCLVHAIKPKDYLKRKYPEIKHSWNVCGLPELIVIDNGKEFRSTHLVDACLQLKIKIQYSPPYEPWYRGTIERFFGTLNTRLIHTLPGTTYSNIDMKGIDYNPSKDAVIDLAKLERLIHKWIVDDYHQTIHRGINDTPAKAWKKETAKFPVAFPESMEELPVVLGMVAERTVRGRGIELEKIQYDCKGLNPLRYNGKVKVKYDPTDLSTIFAFDEAKRVYIPVPALNMEYAQGLTLTQHRVITKYVADVKEETKEDITLCQARKEIMEYVDSAIRDTKRNAARMKFHRIRGKASSTEQEPEQPAVAGEGDIEDDAPVDIQDYPTQNGADSNQQADEKDIDDYMDAEEGSFRRE